ncbi:LytTR family transcriptional regulator DNA-binding domain-containing protein [Priestia flexa]|uniref:LytTR family transcriptional regulator DNA-binding domain-containing protein n=1 Tax=Priestia flexa TaxID=86664 RepID=UPI000953CD97|nr:LytTR family transcriptional regulator DNA-binding domain-containing protein [Priestia flexa]SIQ61593.1 transcriptional regulator, LytTR family [Priestia flexa]
MDLLNIEGLEKSIGNNIIIPSFNLSVNAGETIALKCNYEVGNQLINMLIGDISISGGQVLFKGNHLNKNFKEICKKIGIVFLNENFYERLTVKQYLTLFKNLYEIDLNIPSLLHRVGLLEHYKTKIKNLNFSEKKRLQFARVILPDPELLIFEEPNQNIDMESKMIIQKILTELSTKGKAILILTNYFENAVILTDKVYSLDRSGLKQISVLDETKQESKQSLLDEKKENKEIEQSESPFGTNANNKDLSNLINLKFNFEKIPAKVNDKIILFDPTEISFVESNEGISNLHVNGEIFPCHYTLNELLERLQVFGFFRSHRSYIVNLQKVREVITWSRNSYSLILDDYKKTPIPLSKGKLGELKRIIGL